MEMLLKEKFIGFSQTSASDKKAWNSEKDCRGLGVPTVELGRGSLLFLSFTYKM
jgi:hypothetical protein